LFTAILIAQMREDDTAPKIPLGQHSIPRSIIGRAVCCADLMLHNIGAVISVLATQRLRSIQHFKFLLRNLGTMDES
jgi:hypothetical protein